MSPDPPPWTESQQISQVNKDMKYKRSADEKARLPVRVKQGLEPAGFHFQLAFPRLLNKLIEWGSFLNREVIGLEL